MHIMPHSTVAKALRVLETPDVYPVSIVHLARYICERNNERREAISRLWRDRSVWHRWNEFRHKSQKRSELERRREASRLIAGIVKDRETLNTFHKSLGLLRSAEPFVFYQFEACMKLHECTDYVMIHRYLACVVTCTRDSTLEPVSFIRAAGSFAEEIIAWKLKNLFESHVIMNTQ